MGPLGATRGRITVQLQGLPEDAGHIRFSDFLAQLEAVRTALKNTERLVTGFDEPSVYYRIVDLHHSSPATVVIEAVSKTEAPAKKAERRATGTDYSQATVAHFFTSLRDIREQKKPPRNADLQALEAYRDLGSIAERHISDARIIDGDYSISIDAAFRSAIDEIIGPDEIVEGSIYGMLEKVNLHNTMRFDIFPTVGPKRVACDFPIEMKQEVIHALDQYVNVSGKLRYKRLSPFPYAINVSGLEILPPETELPSMYDLRGIAPGATGKMSADEFIESIRDAAGW